MTFTRLTRGDWLAAVAALALLLVMAMDWYTTDQGAQARKDEKQIQPRGATAGEVGRALDESARIAAEEAEQNAWQADPFPDRVILFALLATVALAIASAFLRAAGMRFEPPWTPSALTTCVALGAAILLAARIVQKPSVDIGSVIKLGAPLGLVCVGTVALGARAAWNAERDGSAWDEGKKDGKTDPFADTDETEALSNKPAPLFDHSAPPDAQPAPEAEATTATAVRPVAADAPTAEDEEDFSEAWAPDWSDPAGPDAPPLEPEPTDRSRRRRRRTGSGGRGGRNRRRRT